MGSQTLKLPTIDLSNVRQDDSKTWESTKIRVLEALQEYGCFEAIYDSIPLDIKKSFVDGIHQFFNMSLEKKKRYASGNSNRYNGQFEFGLQEGFGIEDIESVGAADDFINITWPLGNPTFRNSTKLFYEHLCKIDKMVRRMILEGLGLEKYMEEHMNSTKYAAAVQKYCAPHTSETTTALNGHIDPVILGILHQLNVGGLEILTKDGKNWISPNRSPNSFVVLIGTAFHAWTNGRLHPPYHQVVMTGDEDRYSIALVTDPKPGTMIKAPEEMVDEEHPLLFKPFEYSNFFQFFKSDRRTIDTVYKYFGA